MLEAVIFDFGGVFTTSPSRPSRGLSASAACRPTSSAGSTRPTMRITPGPSSSVPSRHRRLRPVFAAEVATLGHEVRGKDVLPLLSGDLRPEMIEALRRMKARSRPAASPTTAGHGPAPEIGGSRSIAEIDGTVRRRDRERQDRPAQTRSAHLPDDVSRRWAPRRPCVYLDDLGINLKPARDMGMTTIKVSTRPQAIAELEMATGMELK